MSEVGVEIVKTEETKEGEIKYLNINVSNSEVERNPDVVRLHSDAGTLEYVKPKANVLNKIKAEIEELTITYLYTDHLYTYVKVDDVKKIIDKYKAESEDAPILEMLSNLDLSMSYVLESDHRSFTNRETGNSWLFDKIIDWRKTIQPYIKKEV